MIGNMKKTIKSLEISLCFCVCVFAVTASWAANGVWNGTVNTLWTNSANWSVSPYPLSDDTASFTNNGSGQTNIDITAIAGIKNIIFDSPFVGPYTIGTGATNSQTLVMRENGEIKLTDTAANSQLFNCGLQLGATIVGGTYTLTNGNMSQTLTFNDVFGPVGGAAAGLSGGRSPALG